MPIDDVTARRRRGCWSGDPSRRPASTSRTSSSSSSTARTRAPPATSSSPRCSSTDGRILLVERGFVPLGVDPAEVAAAPTGDGRRRRPPAPTGGASPRPAQRPADRRPRPRPNASTSNASRRSCPVPSCPLTSSSSRREPAEAGPFPNRSREPELSEGPHLSYAGQWFLFAAAVVVGWVLAVRHSVKTRRAGASKPKAASPAPVDEPAEGVGAAPPVIARLTSPAEASTRRYADHSGSGSSKNASKNAPSSFGESRSRTSSPWSCRTRVRRAARGHTACQTPRVSSPPRLHGVGDRLGDTAARRATTLPPSSPSRGACTRRPRRTRSPDHAGWAAARPVGSRPSPRAGPTPPPSATDAGGEAIAQRSGSTAGRAAITVSSTSQPSPTGTT